jgi:hypothetical protein
MEKIMRKLIPALLLFGTTTAFSCPDISGTYKCLNDGTLESTKTLIQEKIENGYRITTTTINHWEKVDSTPLELTVEYNGKTVQSHYYGEPTDYTTSCDETGFSEKMDDGLSSSVEKIIKTADNNLETHYIGEFSKSISERCTLAD